MNKPKCVYFDQLNVTKWYINYVNCSIIQPLRYITMNAHGHRQNLERLYNIATFQPSLETSSMM